MTVSIALPLTTLSDEEGALVKEMLDRLSIYNVENMLKEAYYNGEQTVRQLGISIPPALTSINTIVGWAGIAVDVLDERLEWQGWRSYNGDDYGLGDIYRDNDLAIESGLGTKDCLIHGTNFIAVGAGFDGEPNPLITVESARSMTGIRNGRTRRLEAALAINDRDSGGTVTGVTLYLENSNLYLTFSSGVWWVTDRWDHNFGRVLVAQMVNRPRASSMGGSSEITPALRSYVDTGVRTMLGMEVNREFYSFPQRWTVGADPSQFMDDAGNPVPSFVAAMSKFLIIPDNENQNTPQVGQFTAASPAPYLEQMRGLAQMVAAEAGIPASYLGFVSDNPTSADAIRQAEARLIKRAERRQLMYGKAWSEVGRLALLVRDGEVPEGYNDIGTKWADAATPTRSAAADEAVKLIGAGVLPADSTVTYDRLGLDPDEQRQLVQDKRLASATQRVADIRAAVEGTA